MYRLAICDDNQADVSYLRSLVEKWAGSVKAALKIESCPSAEAFLFQYEEDKSFDLLFLDIEMGGMSGVELALCEIRYLEVRRNYVTIYGEEAYTVKKTLNELEEELDESFFRTGRSHIVNLNFVKKITRTQVIFKDGRTGMDWCALIPL